MAKGQIFKIKCRSTLLRPWVSILPSGKTDLFHTWDEAAEFQGAPLKSRLAGCIEPGHFGCETVERKGERWLIHHPDTRVPAALLGVAARG